MSFASDLSKFEAKTVKRMDAVRRKTALDLFSAVIRDTPVDTGRARGNWQTSVGTIIDNIVDRDDKAGSQATADIVSALSQWSEDEPIIMQNNLPYIEVLEDGSSDQSPNGMVVKNVKRFDGLIDKALAKLK